MFAYAVVKTTNLVISRCCLSRGPQKYEITCVQHVQHDYFSYFNQSNIRVLWSFRSRSHRRFLNSLILLLTWKRASLGNVEEIEGGGGA